MDRRLRKLPLRPELFWSKVDKSGGPEACWPWMGGTITAGYGEFKVDGRDVYTHRLAWELSNGRKPTGFVLHTCDNPPCCNPAHLYDGSPAANMHDRAMRGRQRGRYGDGKLNVQKVRVIRELKTAGVQQRWMAKFFGVSETLISEVVLRKAWKLV